MIPDLATGGAERFVTDLCNTLVNEGNQVTLITLFDTKGADSFLPFLSDKVKYLCLHKKSGISVTLPFIILFKIIKEKPSVVHTHLNCFIYTILAWIILYRIKFVHTVHNDAFKEAGSEIELKMKKIAFGRFVIPVTISDESQRSFCELYKRDSCLIYNGRSVGKEEYSKEKQIEDEINSLKTTPNSLVIINLARFAAQKNQLSLVEAINIINKNEVKMDLFMFGSYQHSQDALDIYNNINKIKTPQIHIMGVRSNASSFLKYADAFCLSSNYEGMPISVIESFAHGCPVLSTPVGGVVNMVQNGENGILSRNTEVESIVEMLMCFYNLTKEEKKTMREKAKESYTIYSMEKCAQSYQECFKNEK